MIKISASILDVKITDLAYKMREVDELVDSFHFDLADGCFVPNLSFGPRILKDLREVSKKPFEAHLMVLEPSKYFENLKGFAETVYFHLEASKNVKADISRAREMGFRVGLAISTETDVSKAFEYLDDLNVVLVMLVRPGYGGQPMDELQLNKISELRSYISKNNISCDIAADGGIKYFNAEKVVRAGANSLVSGSGIFAGDPVEALSNFKRVLKAYDR
ncbi:MAG: ribulose-phosphate 3-epimerase [Nitrososphaeria archaeon]